HGMGRRRSALSGGVGRVARSNPSTVPRRAARRGRQAVLAGGIARPDCRRGAGALERLATDHGREHFMSSRALWTVAAVAMAMTLPSALPAQVLTLKDYHVADVEELRSKFVALAGAIPADRYDWKPM